MSDRLTDDSHEMAVIGSLILVPGKLDWASTVLSRVDFGRQELGEFYEFILDLHSIGRPVNDIKLVSSEVNKRGLEITIAQVAEAFSSVPNPSHLEFYVEKVAEQSRLRQLLQLTASAHESLLDPSADSANVVDEIESGLRLVGSNASIEIDDPDSAIAKFEHEIETRVMAASGIDGFDSHCGGFSAGELITIGARLGTGKTALGWQILLHSARQGKNCLFASLEMGTRQLIERHFASATGIPPNRIRTDSLSSSEYDRIDYEKEAYRHLPLSIYATFDASVRHIGAAARLKRSGSGLDLLCIDYVQLLKAAQPARDRRLELEAISRQLKSLAMELQIPIIVLAQLNRVSDNEQIIPKVSHIAECDNIGRDSDQVLLLHRHSGKTDLRVAKHRYVPDNKVIELRFNAGRFEEPSHY